MSPQQWQRVQSLFDEALALPENERSGFVHAQCRGDELMASEVRSLLEAYDGGEEELEASPVLGLETATTAPESELSGYDLLEELHRGGQGIVYRAIQRSTKREVAVKVMLAGALAGPVDKRRFEREVELAGGLSHPGIVPIFDSGLANDQYFYAMELVDGVRLDQYIREQSCSHREILELFLQICEAIDHAHQKRVIHRDIKPSNVLVDDRGRVRVLDFGLAKHERTNEDETATLALSMTGQVMGTLAYMSPEQAGGRAADADARSDVYSLSVMLYELLTGSLPYELDFSLAENLSKIKLADPAEAPLKSSRVDGEVSTILLMGLRKEKDRRYRDAGALGRDIDRYLRGQPIEARRASAIYVLQKSLRRNVIPIGIAAALLVGILIGSLMMGDPSGRATRSLPAPLQPLADGGRFSQLDYENQQDAIQDMIRRGDEPPDLIRELVMRFEWLEESKFQSLDNERKADLQIMSSLARFFAGRPDRAEIQRYQDGWDGRWRGDETNRPSGLAVSVVDELLSQAAAADPESLYPAEKPPETSSEETPGSGA